MFEHVPRETYFYWAIMELFLFSMQRVNYDLARSAPFAPAPQTAAMMAYPKFAERVAVVGQYLAWAFLVLIFVQIGWLPALVLFGIGFAVVTLHALAGLVPLATTLLHLSSWAGAPFCAYKVLQSLGYLS